MEDTIKKNIKRVMIAAMILLAAYLLFGMKATLFLLGLYGSVVLIVAFFFTSMGRKVFSVLLVLYFILFICNMLFNLKLNFGLPVD